METNSEKIGELLEKAKLYINRNKVKSAKKPLIQALKLAESKKIKVLILESLVDCAISLNENEASLKYLEELCELELTFHSAAKLIQMYVYFFELGKSLEVVNKIKKLEVKDDGERQALIDLYLSAGVIEDALDEYDIWKETNPEDVDVKIDVFKRSLFNVAHRNTYGFYKYGHRVYKMGEEIIAHNAEKEVYKELADLYRKLFIPTTAMDYLRKYTAYSKENNDMGGYFSGISEMFMYNHYSGLLEDDEYIKYVREIYDACMPEKVNTKFNTNTNYLKKIRVGFVSSDFAAHSVGKFISSLFKQKITNSEIEIYCYYTFNHKDDITVSISKSADVFKFVGHYHNEQLGEEFFKDKLDIIIDLNNRSYGTKLSLLSLRFAPVQMTWMGFPFTCAMPNIDYAIGDPYLDPPDNSTEKYMTEKIARMKPSYMCYAMDINYNFVHVAEEPPCVKNGYITFGNMNNPGKFSPHTLKLWGAVLEAVPGSKLYLKIPDMDGFLLDKVKEYFKNFGIDWSRIITSPITDPNTYMNDYNDIDILLDTTPFSGCTTLAESFFMGMPTVSLKGQFRQSRHCVLLEQVGLGDLPADSDGDYVNKAKALANDVDRIKKIKRELPLSIMDSPLFDTFNFRLSFENMIRQTYVRYCYNNKKPFDAQIYENNMDMLVEDCLRTHDILNYLISDGEDADILLSVIKEYYEMATLLLPMILAKGGLSEDAAQSVSLSLSVLTLLNTVKDPSTAVKLVESNNKLLYSLLA